MCEKSTDLKRYLQVKYKSDIYLCFKKKDIPRISRKNLKLFFSDYPTIVVISFT